MVGRVWFEVNSLRQPHPAQQVGVAGVGAHLAQLSPRDSSSGNFGVRVERFNRLFCSVVNLK